MKRIISLILSLSLVFTPLICVNAESSQKQISTAEDRVEVISISDNHELVHFDNITIEDLATEKYRKIITECGTDVSVYYEDYATGVATLSLNGSIIETYNMVALRNNYTIWNMPYEDQLLLEKSLIDQIDAKHISLPSELKEDYTVTYSNNGSIVINPAPNEKTNSTRAANTVVRPAGSVTDTYPVYYYKEVNSKSQYSSYCERYLDMAIKDSMYSYTQISKKTYVYAAQTVVAIIAGALKIASSSLINSLLGLTTVVNGILKLSTDIEYYFSESYRFYALRQAYVYDYTYNYRDVSVTTEHGTGEISLTWNLNNNNEHIDPCYRITGVADPFTVSYATLYAEALDIWEFNMYEYGYWSWGDI